MGRIFGLRDPDHPGGLIHAIKFSTEWYRINMPPLQVAFQDEGMLALAKDADHLTDCRLAKIIRGVPQIPAVRTGETDKSGGTTAKKRHGDFLVALALAHFASREQWAEFDYIPISSLASQKAGADEDDDDFNSGYGRRHW